MTEMILIAVICFAIVAGLYGIYGSLTAGANWKNWLLEQALPRVAPLLRPGARVYVESATAFAAPGGWRVLRQGRAGQVHYTLVTYDN